MDCSPPGSFVHGISQARILDWVAISFSRGSFQSRDRTHISCLHLLQADSLPLERSGKPIILCNSLKILWWWSHFVKPSLIQGNWTRKGLGPSFVHLEVFFFPTPLRVTSKSVTGPESSSSWCGTISKEAHSLSSYSTHLRKGPWLSETRREGKYGCVSQSVHTGSANLLFIHYNLVFRN